MALSAGQGGTVLPAAESLPAFSARTRLLVIAPHPDDETIATGLLVQQVIAAGGAVRIVLLTPGDNNPWPQRWLERRLWVGAAARRRWGQRRCGEMRLALQRLGLDAQVLHPLGWPDLGVTGVLQRAAPVACEAIGGIIDDFDPDLIAAPDLADHHPDHAAAHVLLRLALARRADPPRVLAYLVHGQDGAARRIEVTGSDAQRSAKSAALSEHRSQMALSSRRMHRLAGRPERYAIVPRPPAARPLVLPWQPSRLWHPWLRISLASAEAVVSWHWRDAPLQRDADGCFHVLPDAVGKGPCFVRLASVLPSPWIFDRWGWHELAG